MRLPRPFYRLPFRFDAARLAAEIATLDEAAWVPHPNGLPGNSSVRLISVDGEENDEVDGTMRCTPHLAGLPYVRQVLASFGVVWSRSRLMRLDAGAVVPGHADINHHWFTRVRVHIPVVTRPTVRFYCDTASEHMAVGEAWIFDSWRRHRVENRSDTARIHLVADTSGSAAFWQSVAATATATPATLAFDATRDVWPLTETAISRKSMPAAEVEWLLADLRSELVPRDESEQARRDCAHFHALLDAFCRDWRQLQALHGEGAAAREPLARLRDELRRAVAPVAHGLTMRTNGVAAVKVLEARVLQHVLPATRRQRSVAATVANASKERPRERIDRPVFIVCAPRSGSTLLFETLATTPQWATLGGEAHWLIESDATLRPGAPGVESNRLTGAQATEPIAERIRALIAEHARLPGGRSLPAEGYRVLEKTPKNALRVPFLQRVFPDARFVLLWRDPRDSLASIMEAWRSGRFVTYRDLPDGGGPWSLLLPPGWREKRAASLTEIAAFQWESANRIALEDLDSLPASRRHCVRYEDFLAQPRETIRALCNFAEIDFDRALATRVGSPLPPSRYTISAPARDKWRREAAAILDVLPSVEMTWRRLEAVNSLPRQLANAYP